MFGPTSDYPHGLQIPDAPTKGGGGMFGGGKVSIDLGRALAGYLAGIGNPAGVQALQAMNQLRERQLEHQQSLDDYNRKRADDNTDWQAHYDYKLQNPEPVNNDTANDYSFWQQHLSPEQFKQWLENKVNPPQYMNVPGVGLVQIPRSAPGAPTAPVGKLTPIPGAGGPAPGSGGFPY